MKKKTKKRSNPQLSQKRKFGGVGKITFQESDGAHSEKKSKPLLIGNTLLEGNYDNIDIAVVTFLENEFAKLGHRLAKVEVL